MLSTVLHTSLPDLQLPLVGKVRTVRPTWYFPYVLLGHARWVHARTRTEAYPWTTRFKPGPDGSYHVARVIFESYPRTSLITPVTEGPHPQGIYYAHASSALSVRERDTFWISPLGHVSSAWYPSLAASLYKEGGTGPKGCRTTRPNMIQ